METKGITCKIPQKMHNRISEDIRASESTMGKFIEMVIGEHYEREENSMSKTRTLAFQVSEELFQQIKEYLAWYEGVYHRRLTQKQFILELIENELNRHKDEHKAPSQEEEPETSNAAEE